MRRILIPTTIFCVFTLVGSAILPPAIAAGQPRVATISPADCTGPGLSSEDLKPYSEEAQGQMPEPTPTPEVFEIPAYTAPPAGAQEQADGQTIELVTTIAQGMLDCYNANDNSRLLAFFTNNFFNLLLKELGPLTDQQLESLTVVGPENDPLADLDSVSDVWFLEDGRVAALIIIRDPEMASALRSDEFPAEGDLLSYAVVLAAADNGLSAQFDDFMLVDTTSLAIGHGDTAAFLRARHALLPNILGVRYGGAVWGPAGSWWWKRQR